MKKNKISLIKKIGLLSSLTLPISIIAFSCFAKNNYNNLSKNDINNFKDNSNREEDTNGIKYESDNDSKKNNNNNNNLKDNEQFDKDWNDSSTSDDQTSHQSNDDSSNSSTNNKQTNANSSTYSTDNNDQENPREVILNKKTTNINNWSEFVDIFISKEWFMENIVEYDKSLSYGSRNYFLDIKLENIMSEKMRKDKEVVIHIINNTKNFDINFLLEYHAINNDKEVALAFLKRNADYFDKFSERIKNDKEVALAAIEQDSQKFKLISNRLKKDKDIISKAIQNKRGSIHYDDIFKTAPLEIFEDKEFMLKVIKKKPAILLTKWYKFKDKNHILEAIKNSSGYLIYGSLNREFKEDKEIILEAFRFLSYFDYFPENIWNDREFVINAIKKHGNSYSWVNFEELSRRFSKDREISLIIAKYYPKILSRVPSDFTNDKNLFLVGVKKDGYFLKYASEDLRNDKELVIEAIKTNVEAYKFASEFLKKDKEVALAAINKDASIFEYIDYDLQEDDEIINLAVKLYGKNLRLLSYENQNNKNLVFLAIKQDPLSLEFASENLKSDKEIVLSAVKKDGSSLKFASDILKTDKEVVIEALKQSIEAFRFMSENFKYDKDVATLAISKDYSKIQEVSDELKNDRDIVLTITRNRNISIIELANTQIGNDWGFYKKPYDFLTKFLKDEEILFSNIKKYAGGFKISHPSTWNHYSGYNEPNEKFIAKAIKENILTLLYFNESNRKDIKKLNKILEEYYTLIRAN